MRTADINEFTRSAISSAMDSLQNAIQTIDKLDSNLDYEDVILDCTRARMMLAESLLLNDVISAG